MTASLYQSGSDELPAFFTSPPHFRMVPILMQFPGTQLPPAGNVPRYKLALAQSRLPAHPN
jgi:hypothetical protein